MSKLQKLLVGFFVVGLPYMKERLTKVRQVTEKFPAFDLVSKTCSIVMYRSTREKPLKAE